MSGGVRISPYFALGAGISWFNTEETASVSAQLPHPLYFNRNRSISGVSSPLTRSEMAVHLQAHVVVPATNSLTVMGFAGPTFFNVEQQLVTDVNFVHTYPFDTATFSSAVASRNPPRLSDSTWEPTSPITSLTTSVSAGSPVTAGRR